ncbi:MAG TPA: fused MFS/spermidine synthase [Dongiaceae bacterium]|nr:fused MFS/spermidine synthase [Dongiaceae bacterium]
MPFSRTILYAGQSPYGSYKVVDTIYNGRPARVLYGSKRSPQSGVARDDNPELLFDYNQRFFEMVMSKQPKRVLVIGGGAFMLPTALFHRFPKMLIDVVEIDPLLVKLARDFFDLPDSKRLSVHMTDGILYAKKTRKKYDMIIIDAFSGYTIPHHLLEQAAALQYQHRLKKGGIVTMNFISDYKQGRPHLAHEILATFSEVFSYVGLYQADPDYLQGEEQNLLLVAGAEGQHFEYLHSEELSLLQ